MKLTNRIPWGAFSDKHKEYIKESLNYRHSVAEGAVRSGKTIDHCIIFAMYLEQCPDKIHLASGSSLPNAKLNIGECNGFGLEHLFRGRCRWGKYKSNECLYIQTQTGEKIVIFSGGGKADSYKSILGNSYGGWIATEINEHYDNEDSRISFIKVAMARQLASKDPFTLWDLNPSNPHADIYKNYIDKYKAYDWYRYEHFNIFDNATMSEEAIEQIKQKYDPNSVWYRRDILGERAVAEGLCFRYYADQEDKYTFDESELYKNDTHTRENLKRQFERIIIGVDFGDNGSKYSWCATGFMNGWINLYPLADGDIDKSNDINTEKLCVEFFRFFVMVLQKYGAVDYVFCDSASNTLINTLRTYLYEQGYDGSVIMPVVKNELTERPKLIDSLLYTGRMKISKNCVRVRKALKSLVWDKKRPDVPEDLNIDNINDYYDSFCYSFITHTQYIELKR